MVHLVALAASTLSMLATVEAARQFNPTRHVHKRAQSFVGQRDTGTQTFQFLNNKTAKYAVDGASIPLYPYDVGESYAGLMPIAQDYRVDKNSSDDRQLFFWFYPSNNINADDEIAIWLTGGPGCSSLVAMLQENGPFIWSTGTAGPVTNAWSWHRLTNIVYVEFPVGVGYTTGLSGLYENNSQTAREFLGFWKNFVETFDLHGRKVYVTGESYAGYYVPFIADQMLNANDTTHFNLEATLLYDPAIGAIDTQQAVSSFAMAQHFKPLLPMGEGNWTYYEELAESCGYTSFLEEWLVYPAKGIQPQGPGEIIATNETCDIYFNMLGTLQYINPCLYPYEITQGCPYQEDAVRNIPGPGEQYYNGEPYFNRTDTKKAIHAPVDVTWKYCTTDPVFVNDTDTTVPPIFSVLPSVIERSKRTMILGGTLDWALPSNGTLLAIQNMTWGGNTGFAKKPSDQFYVPFTEVAYDGLDDGNAASLSGTGIMGVTTTERGLTWVDTFLAGHQGPMWQAASAFRHFEFLLGRVDRLNSTQDWSITIG